jgi:hypothetical protein
MPSRGDGNAPIHARGAHQISRGKIHCHQINPPNIEIIASGTPPRNSLRQLEQRPALGFRFLRVASVRGGASGDEMTAPRETHLLIGEADGSVRGRKPAP